MNLLSWKILEKSNDILTHDEKGCMSQKRLKLLI